MQIVPQSTTSHELRYSLQLQAIAARHVTAFIFETVHPTSATKVQSSCKYFKVWRFPHRPFKLPAKSTGLTYRDCC